MKFSSPKSTVIRLSRSGIQESGVHRVIGSTLRYVELEIGLSTRENGESQRAAGEICQRLSVGCASIGAAQRPPGEGPRAPVTPPELAAERRA